MAATTSNSSEINHNSNFNYNLIILSTIMIITIVSAIIIFLALYKPDLIPGLAINNHLHRPMLVLAALLGTLGLCIGIGLLINYLSPEEKIPLNIREIKDKSSSATTNKVKEENEDINDAEIINNLCSTDESVNTSTSIITQDDKKRKDLNRSMLAAISLHP